MHCRQQLAWACMDQDTERERPEGQVMYVRNVAHRRASHGTSYDHDVQAAAGVGILHFTDSVLRCSEGRPWMQWVSAAGHIVRR